MQLKWAQSLPRERKIATTEWLIAEAVDQFGLKAVAVSYSTGKDSAVLSHIARQLYPDILHIFANTGCEYPESVKLYKKQRNEFNLIQSLPVGGWNFKRVVQEYGYPMFSKDISRINRAYRNARNNEVRERILEHMEKYKAKYIKFLDKVRLSDKCCEKLKHGPLEKLERKMGIQCSIVGTMAEESMLRRISWIDYGCNVFHNTKSPRSRPVSFWTEKDIWNYIREFNVEASDLYKMGYRRNGCMYCGFGVHLEKGINRIQQLQLTHTMQHKWMVENFRGYFEACGIKYQAPVMLFDWKTLCEIENAERFGY
jgi:3'-phosphoadenosine 5'-phosphosulfate sulfotransferase (PAPS reductase)/FAD synthetase